MSAETRTKLESYGFKVYTSSHVLSGAERSLSSKFGGIVPYGEDIIAIAGSGCGADTAVIIRPAHSANILETKIKKIICKPAQW